MSAPDQPKVLPAETIRLAFQLLLGHDPASNDVVKAFQKHKTLDELRKALLATPEFKRRRLPPIMKSALDTLRYGPRRVDIEVTPEQLEQLFERLRTQWTKLGETEPHWSVLSSAEFKAANFAKNEAKFYKSGHNITSQITNTFKRVGVEMKRAGTAFELGCGTGRVTHALADVFARVVGADVSPGNLRLCEEKMRALNKANVECRLLKSPGDIESLPPIDFFFSTIVLQHNPPPVMHYFLSKIFSKVTPGGAVMFQVPTHTPHYTFNVHDYLSTTHRHTMDMHALPMHAVLDLLAEHKLSPLEVLMDTQTGDLGSHTFFAVRK